LAVIDFSRVAGYNAPADPSLLYALFARGLVGESNNKTTHRDPQRGHFERPSSIEIGKAPPLVHMRVSRSSRMLALHPLTVSLNLKGRWLSAAEIGDVHGLLISGSKSGVVLRLPN
jgi:hypothetical protein